MEEELKNKESNCDLSWANNTETSTTYKLDNTAMLPLFKEQAHSPAMIKHSLSVIQKAVELLNQNQVPIVAFDQPLYAIAKKIQWIWPESFGEKNFVIMFGGLHIELTALKALGKWLDNSGWVAAITQSGLASAGTADSFLKASHITKTRHAHQVTVAALHILKKKAYVLYCENITVPKSFMMWKSDMEKEIPMFMFWSTTIKFQLTVLNFVRSIREQRFDLYKAALIELMPWFFSLDHPNYARWISVHINDMYQLDDKHPFIAEKFREGKFTVNKTGNNFSSIAIDHAHEQNNKCVKGDGGVIGLTEDSAQLLRWMVSGPEIARLVNDFQADVNIVKHCEEDVKSKRHHEQINSVQKTFKKQVDKLCEVFEECGNPFAESSQDLIVLDTRDIVEESVITTVKTIHNIGKNQFDTFMKERVIGRTVSLFQPIKGNKLPLFSRPKPKKKTALMQEVSTLKQNCSLFSQLYISCQVREGNLDDFFSHENQNSPPSISQHGKLRFGQKSQLLECLENTLSDQDTTESPDVQVKVIDGAVIVNILKPKPNTTFEEYAKYVFIKYIQNQLKNAARLDLIWDRYLEDSLKGHTRQKRGKGIRRQVSGKTKTPSNWQEFLRIDNNKTELFQYLAEKVTEAIKEKLVISTVDTSVICNHGGEDVSFLSDCNHEEADTRIFLHVKDASNKSYRNIMVRTVDTDVVVIAVYVMQHVQLEKMWILFGVGKKMRYIPIHELCNSLTPEKCIVLPLFHALTGCDQSSSFAGRSKKTAWTVWKMFDELTNSLESIHCCPSADQVQSIMPTIERFVTLMYDRGSTCATVNDARKDLFTKKGRMIEAIPPTANALFLHLKRSVYQGSFVWGQVLRPIQSLPSPEDWGWRKGVDSTWEPFWTTLPPASKACHELIKCGCNPEKGCNKNRCKCIKSNLPCTSLCKCGGECDAEKE